MSIHHAILKQAAKLNATIAQQDDGTYVVTDMAGNTTVADTAKAAMAAFVAKAPKAHPAKAKQPKAKKTRTRAPSVAEQSEDADEEGDSEGEDEEDNGKSVVKKRYKRAYRPHKDTCGDDFVSAFSSYLYPEEGVDEMDLGRLRKVQKDNGIDGTRWLKLNPGMQRMNTGNVLRGMLRRGEDVHIGGQTLKGEKQ